MYAQDLYMQCLNTGDMRVTHIKMKICLLLRLLNGMRTQNPCKSILFLPPLSRLETFFLENLSLKMLSHEGFSKMFNKLRALHA